MSKLGIPIRFNPTRVIAGNLFRWFFNHGRHPANESFGVRWKNIHKLMWAELSMKDLQLGVGVTCKIMGLLCIEVFATLHLLKRFLTSQSKWLSTSLLKTHLDTIENGFLRRRKWSLVQKVKIWIRNLHDEGVQRSSCPETPTRKFHTISLQQIMNLWRGQRERITVGTKLCPRAIRLQTSNLARPGGMDDQVKTVTSRLAGPGTSGASFCLGLPPLPPLASSSSITILLAGFGLLDRLTSSLYSRFCLAICAFSLNLSVIQLSNKRVLAPPDSLRGFSSNTSSPE